MKILVSEGEGALKFYRLGLARVLSQIGYEITIINTQVKPLWDAFAENKPDAYLCGSWEISEGMVRLFEKYPDTNLILFCCNWSDETKDHVGVLNASEQSVKLTERVINQVANKVCFSYYHQKWLPHTHNRWKEIGLTSCSVPLGADIFDYFPAEYSPELACDVGFVGGYWPFKAESLDKYLIPLCHPSEELNVKIFGYGGWPVSQWLGGIATENMKKLFSSAKVSPCVYEPLVQYGYDLSERIFKVLACGGFTISQYSQTGKEDFFPNGIVKFVKTPEIFIELVRYYCEHSDERWDGIETGVKAIYNSHTYHERVNNLLQDLGWMDKLPTLDKIRENTYNTIPERISLARRNHERICVKNDY